MESTKHNFTPAELAELNIPELLPRRPERSNKGTFGRVLCAAGSYCMSGAAYLCAKAAYRCGAGLVEVLTPEENRIIIQSTLPEAVLTVFRNECPDPEALRKAAERATVMAIGPGMGRSEGARTVLKALLQSTRVPTVLDADALNILSEDESLWELVPEGTVITPHPGEMSRLCGRGVGEILDALPEFCGKFAREHRVICVLKDHATAVSDGERLYVNSTGNSGMATGGSGDVLTGIIAALLAAGLPPFEAAALGVRIHGAAGDIAAETLGEYSLMASDIIYALPRVLNK